MFYDHFVTLCHSRGVTPSRAAVDAGLSKSTVTKWKKDPTTKPTGNVIDKLTRYFGITVAELLGYDDQPPAGIAPPPLPEVEPGEPVPFYDRYVSLCRQRNVSPSRAAVDAGLSKSVVTKWKNDPEAQPTGSVIRKLSAYFGITVAELLGTVLPPLSEADDEAIKFALFGGGEDITPEMFEEVRQFARFVKEREARRRYRNQPE